MLELRGVSVVSTRAAEENRLLDAIDARFAPGQLHAVVGPSGCGKSTLLKVIAGVRQPNEGGVFWAGRDLEVHDLAPNEIGYVPQFGIAFDLLTVGESIETALRLRVGGLSERETSRARAAHFLVEAGLAEIADRRVGILSGGQKRRLALALEMVSEPHFLLCDEVTSGLDPKAESEIVHLLHSSRAGGGTHRHLGHAQPASSRTARLGHGSLRRPACLPGRAKFVRRLFSDR